MTDKQIIKAWEQCFEGRDCRCCAYYDTFDCSRKVRLDVVAIINRQKAEIEKLKIELQAMRNAANGYKAEIERLYRIIADKDYSFAEVTSALRLAKELLETEKSETIKEFSERFQSTLDKRLGDDIPILGDRDNVYCTVSDIYDVIDSLVKEMTEANKNER